MTVFIYDPLVTDSNFEPITVEIKRNGRLVSLEGMTGTIRVQDEDSHELIVDNKPTTLLSPGYAEYYFSPDEVAKIKRASVWLVEWRIIDAANDRELRMIPAKLPVVPKL
jgi:hypothetical protein